MADAALDVFDDLTGRALVPAPIKGFDREPELDDQVAERSSGSISARFSCQRRRRALSSLPMMIRAE
jgi:hypothetical protein